MILAGRNERLLILGVPLFLLAVWIYWIIPWKGFGLCAVNHMLGINCPGCGFIHSVAALLHGELRMSVDFNSMGVVAVVLMVYVWAKSVIAKVVMKRDHCILFSPVGMKVLSGSFVLGLFVQWFVYLAISIRNL